MWKCSTFLLYSWSDAFGHKTGSVKAGKKGSALFGQADFLKYDLIRVKQLNFSFSLARSSDHNGPSSIRARSVIRSHCVPSWGKEKKVYQHYQQRQMPRLNLAHWGYQNQCDLDPFQHSPHQVLSQVGIGGPSPGGLTEGIQTLYLKIQPLVEEPFQLDH